MRFSKITISRFFQVPFSVGGAPATSRTIRTSDQRVQSYREEYDRVASQYNKFMEEHKVAIREIEADSFVDKKPLFQMVAEE